MAFRLERKKTTSTPYVLIDEENSYMKMEGKCFHEKAAEFFRDINNWLDRYLATDFGTFTFDNEINYFNSSTTKLLLNMLLKMDEHSTPENKVVVNWITTAKNDIMIECGEDFQEDCENLKLNMIIKDSE